jgi:hypothetical protein
LIDMTSRKQVQEAHEHDVIRQFITWLNSTTSSHFRVTARPDPPDAVLYDECCSRWVWLEHADIYRSGDEAHEERSLAVAGERDYFHTEHPIVGLDQRLATAFVEILGDKLQKSSYACVFETYGPGILILTERDPLFTGSTIERIQEELTAHDFSADLGCFKHVYLGYRSLGGLRFEPIRYKSTRST